MKKLFIALFIFSCCNLSYADTMGVYVVNSHDGSVSLVQVEQPTVNSKQNFNWAKNQLVKIYNENPKQTEFYCGCEFSFNNKKGTVDFTKCGYTPRKNQTRAERIEWEHVMPAENFGRHLQCWRDGGRKACKKDVTFNLMEGDIHNLQPAIGEVNGDRSNYRYSQFTKEFNQYGKCQSAVDFKGRKFQPRDEIRGTIARTYFYMSNKYNINLSDSEYKLMTEWNKMYPPKQWECKRNQQIKQIQGNDNKLITSQCN
ncbi:endonuclease [Gilliamella sp. ESL0250]|uniref:endonuclease n=1 Tax=Gilliamella sp. ESL0250 TaxID=2705036 RepID=UPI00193453CC|nr:endonuclease [Gilliamella sp. ESL0250]NUF49858.1 deoxyribonuclease [Gilliamella sp. ESL0250]